MRVREQPFGTVLVTAGVLAAGLLGGGAVRADQAATSGTAVEEHAGGGGEAAAKSTEARAGRDPAALIAAMSRALQTLNYEGTFVHLQGTYASSMHILHASDGSGELERMISLDGEAREVIRDHSLVTCIWPASQSVVVSKSKPRKLLPSVDAALASNPSYTLGHVGRDRVAGVATEIVEILPRDRFRYGHRFWIDSETSMLLRSMLLDGMRAIEQVLFTAIEYPESIERSRFDIDAGGERLSWTEQVGLPPSGQSGSTVSRGLPRGVERVRDATKGGTERADRVRFETLPSGYSELSEAYRPMPFDTGPVSHVMVSDGMASVSVYVEHVAAKEQDTSVAGLSSMGAVNAYGLSLDEGFVTVVGEVPPVTVRAIAEAVRLVD